MPLKEPPTKDVIDIVISVELVWLVVFLVFYMAIGLLVSAILWRQKTCSQRVIGAVLWPLLLISGHGD